MEDIKIYSPDPEKKIINVVYRQLLDEDEKNSQAEMDPYLESEYRSADEVIPEKGNEVHLRSDPFEELDVMESHGCDFIADYLRKPI
jgi:hypothetical protein